jgi:hypothetical protein
VIKPAYSFSFLLSINNGKYFVIYKIGLNFKFKRSFTLHMQHTVRKTDVILSLIITIYFTTFASSKAFKDGLSLFRFMLYLESCSGDVA